MDQEFIEFLLEMETLLNSSITKEKAIHIGFKDNWDHHMGASMAILALGRLEGKFGPRCWEGKGHEEVDLNLLRCSRNLYIHCDCELSRNTSRDDLAALRSSPSNKFYTISGDSLLFKKGIATTIRILIQGLLETDLLTPLT